jgi:predicted TIM-barrel fold metal-dependent hydrolase
LTEARVIDAQLHARDRAQVGGHLDAMAAAGVEAALLVQTVPQGHDNGFLLETAAAHPGVFGVVGVLDPEAPDLEDQVAAWSSTSFALGLRVVALSPDRAERLRCGGYDRLAAAASSAGVLLFVYAPRDLGAVEALAMRHPDLRVVLDHAGLLQPPVLQDGEDPWAGLPPVLRIARARNVALKLTAMPTLSSAGPPFEDLWSHVLPLFDAYGADRIMWGTDITREGIGHEYADAVAYVRETDELGATEKELVLGGTLRAFCGWEAAVAAGAAA